MWLSIHSLSSNEKASQCLYENRSQRAKPNSRRSEPFREMSPAILTNRILSPKHYRKSFVKRVSFEENIFKFLTIGIQSKGICRHNSKAKFKTHVSGTFSQRINSFLPSAAYMRKWSGSALVQVMACRLLGAKPLPELMLTYELSP